MPAGGARAVKSHSLGGRHEARCRCGRTRFPFATGPGSRRSCGRGSARHSDLTPADFPKKDVLAVFDISQPWAKKRFYVLDFKSGRVTAHYAAHGRDNGPNARAVKFKGFQRDLDMVPLVPLNPARPEVMDQYRTIVDRTTEPFIET